MLISAETVCSFTFGLEPVEKKARLTVRSNVYQDRVYIDRNVMGSTRLDVELAPGRHTVRVKKEGYVPYEETVELEAGQDSVLRATLIKATVASEPVKPKRPSVASAPNMAVAPNTAIEPQKGETRTEPVPGMEFVWVPPGCVDIGSPKSEAGRSDDERQHRVCVEGFWLSKHEVTSAQYRRFRRDHDSGEYKWNSLNGDDQPVVMVNWHAATDFAAWLTQKTGQHFRPPADAEWEYAARAGTETARYWGESSDEACAYGNCHDKTSRRQEHA